MNLPSREELKAQAKRLRSAMAAAGEKVGHSKALELVAQQHGYRDWNTLHAALGNGPKRLEINLGSFVSGNYLKQPFDGEVVSVTLLSKGRREVTIQFEKTRGCGRIRQFFGLSAAGDRHYRRFWPRFLQNLG